MFNLTLGRTKEEGEGEGEGERVDAIPPKVFSEISPRGYNISTWRFQ